MYIQNGLSCGPLRYAPPVPRPRTFPPVLAEHTLCGLTRQHQSGREVRGLMLRVPRESPFWLLVLTGALWGCTNPFIRQGTKGLRNVRAKSRLGQVYAEIAFLLGNWRYVLPWLANQAGSLAYLAAVQRAPLSVAVPTANGLAFAFTATVGAAVGAEEPLDRWSAVGVLLIVTGTALCCMDRVS